MAGGGCILYTHSAISAIQLTLATTNDVFNVCSVLFCRQWLKTLIVVVYRALWATCDDAKALCKLDDLLHHHAHNVIVAGDFNLSLLQWPDTASQLIH